jgi:hypothetical protein
MCESIRSKNKATEASCSQAPPVRSQDCGRAYLGQKGKTSNQSLNDEALDCRFDSKVAILCWHCVQRMHDKCDFL